MVGISPQETGGVFWGAGGGGDGDGCFIFPAMLTPGEGGAVKSQKGGVCGGG